MDVAVCFDFLCLLPSDSSTFPIWPATVVPCNQTKNKGQVKRGAKGKEVIWVQFFCENSGAWIAASKIGKFHPTLTSKYMVAETEKYGEKQKEAMNVASEDYYFLHKDENPEPPKDEVEGATVTEGPVEETDAAGDEGQSEETPDKSDVAKVAPKGRTRRSSGKVAKSKSKSKTPPKTPAKALAKPEKTPAKRGRDGKGGDKKENAEPSAPRAKKPRLATALPENGTGSETGQEPSEEEEDEEDEEDADANYSDVVMDEQEKPQPKRAPRVRGPSADSKLRALQKSNRKLSSDIAAKDKEITAKAARIAELERKVMKLKNRFTHNAHVRISLPDTPADLPADVPPAKERCAEPMEEDALVRLLDECKETFTAYEASVSAVALQDDELNAAAKKAKHELQEVFDVLKSKTNSMLKKEKDMAELLRVLYRARIAPSAVLSSDVVKKTSRIARRTKANSALLSSLAEAVTTSIRAFCEEEDSKVVDEKAGKNEKNSLNEKRVGKGSVPDSDGGKVGSTDDVEGSGENGGEDKLSDEDKVGSETIEEGGEGEKKAEEEEEEEEKKQGEKETRKVEDEERDSSLRADEGAEGKEEVGKSESKKTIASD